MSNMRVFEVAKRWCEKHPKWKRICDIQDSDGLMLAFDELPRKDRDQWVKQYRDNAEDAWREFAAYRPSRHRFGFIGEDGQFYGCVTHLPQMMNHMMVFETGGKPGVYYVGGKAAKSSTAKV